DVRQVFHEQFKGVYGFVPDREIELESVRIQLREPMATAGMPDLDPLPSTRGPRTRQRVRINGEWTDIAVIERRDINRRAVMDGKVLALDPYSTTFIEPGWRTQ